VLDFRGLALVRADVQEDLVLEGVLRVMMVSPVRLAVIGRREAAAVSEEEAVSQEVSASSTGLRGLDLQDKHIF
jgi:hypothetical protein